MTYSLHVPDQHTLHKTYSIILGNDTSNTKTSKSQTNHPNNPPKEITTLISPHLIFPIPTSHQKYPPSILNSLTLVRARQNAARQSSLKSLKRIILVTISSQHQLGAWYSCC